MLAMTADTQNVIFSQIMLCMVEKSACAPGRLTTAILLMKLCTYKICVLIFYVQERLYSVEPPLIFFYLLKLPLLASLVHFVR